ncbi:uncharacterized protein SCHCODRAFT_02242043 [Schizophyllum commune H4-8]|nr:uncharacterized protein SCHCODRAFT_02242043 [Schizophyllum commune H4-8]KAI5895891.1 hypothetical protein SCHCODRAFT_02242043 [Schizophyllum commune H4-8]
MESELSHSWPETLYPPTTGDNEIGGSQALVARGDVDTRHWAPVNNDSEPARTPSPEMFVGGFVFELLESNSSLPTNEIELGFESTIGAHRIPNTRYTPTENISFPTPQIPSSTALIVQPSPIAHTPCGAVAVSSGVAMEMGAYHSGFGPTLGAYPGEVSFDNEDQLHWREVGSTAHTNASMRRRRPGHEPHPSRTCPRCHRSFTRTHNYRDHIRRHQDEGNFRCSKPGCSSRFNTRNGLRSHLQRIHHDPTRL